MKIKLILILLILNLEIPCFGQGDEIDQNEQQYCDSVKEWVVSNDYQSIILNFITLENINKEKLKKYISSYSNAILNSNLKFNEYNVSELVGNEIRVVSYGYRWATKENNTLYTIDVEVVLQVNDFYIKKIVFVSYDDKLKSLSFPGEEVKNDDLPPATPPLFDER